MTDLLAIHHDVTGCQRCAAFLQQKLILPRSGFPADGEYMAMIVGAEPGARAQDRPSPEEYKRRFDPNFPKLSGRNKAALIFRDMEAHGINWHRFFFTNSTKCPAPTKVLSSRCFSNCKEFLFSQIEAIRPRLVVTLGRAARHLGLRCPKKDEIIETICRGFPAICVRHPQGASREYREEVVRKVARSLVATEP